MIVLDERLAKMSVGLRNETRRATSTLTGEVFSVDAVAAKFFLCSRLAGLSSKVVLLSTWEAAFFFLGGMSTSFTMPGVILVIVITFASCTVGSSSRSMLLQSDI